MIVIPDRLRFARWWSALDVAISVACFGGSLITWNLVSRPSTTTRPDLSVVMVLLLAAATLPFAVRRRRPASASVLSTLAVAVLWSMGYSSAVLPNVLGVLLFTVAAHRPPRMIALSAATYVVCVVTMFVTHAPAFEGADLAVSLALLAAATGVGWSVQTQLRLADAVATRAIESSARAVSEERLQIAREVHDIVAHSLGAIAVQAGAGLHLMDTQPEEAREALHNIAERSRSSLVELRSVLGELRDADGKVLQHPMPGLMDLERLAAESELSQLRVNLDLRVEHPVPKGIGLTAYRIIQEALTNASRHGAARSASVLVTDDGSDLTVDVRDDGSGLASKRTDGHGLLGMHERVALCGGTLRVGPAPTGGFRITARLPYSTDRPPTTTPLPTS